jgi:hypothetical protein
MKKPAIFTIILVLTTSLFVQHAASQNFIKKLKKKTEEITLDGLLEDKNSDDPDRGYNSPANTRGSGLSPESIDVSKSMADATSAYNEREFSDARFSIRMAIQGIELEIGENILDDLPESISGLNAYEKNDQVTSSGIGFVGLVIERTYRGGDQEFQVTIGNDATMLSAANMYLSSGAYGYSNNNEEDFKRIDFKGHKAIIQYDDYSGYKLSVPFGQSSILITEGKNFDTEGAFTEASMEIDIDNIKNQLGEK